MTIITEQSNSSEMLHTSFSDNECVNISTAGVVTEIDEICECVVGKCGFANIVFADLTDNSSYKNDFSSFLFKVDGLVTVFDPNIKLVKSSGEEIEIDTSTTNDFDINQVYSLNPQLNDVLVGFRVEWLKVLEQEGPGQYYFEYTIYNITGPIIRQTIAYDLMNFNPEIAKDTVKLTWFQNGITENGFDFTDFNVSNSLRLFGSMKYLADTIEIDEYENVSRKNIQIQSKVKNKYEMVTELIPKEVGDVLTKDFLLANEIQFTTYNQKTYLSMLDQKLKVIEVSDFVGNYRDNNTGSFTISFENQTQDTVKRNVRF